MFDSLKDFGEARELLTEARYQQGVALYNDKKFLLAKDIFSALETYKESVTYLSEAKYELAKQYLGDGKFKQAAELFDSLGVFKDSRKLLSYAKVDRSDPKSIIDTVRKAIESRDVGLLATFIPEDGVLYTNFFEGGLAVSKEDFIKDLQDRLPYSPICQGVTEEYGHLEIWYMNWNQPWRMDEMCYSGCWQLDPPWTSPYAGFGFRPVDGSYQLQAMILKDPSSFYALLGGENYKPLISCTLYPTCKGAPQTRLAVGMRAEICSTLADPVNVRQSPGLSGERITGLYPNTAVKIIGGPTCAGNSWTWWQIEYQNGRKGWITEGGDDKDKYYLCPIY